MTPGTCVRRRTTTGNRSSRCSVCRSAGRTSRATASCSPGSTTATRSGRRSPGSSNAAVVSSPSACSCAGSSGGARPRCAAVRAVDTATHPDHQGRGLFSALTRHAVEACRTEGVAFVFNTPNEQSRPGYLKLGWREVGRPRAVARPGAACVISSRSHEAVSPRSSGRCRSTSVPTSRSWFDGGGSWPAPAAVSSTDRSLRTASDERFARWRYGLADLHYRVVDDGEAAIVVRLRRRGAGRELVVADQLGDPDRADRLVIETLRRVGRDPRPAAGAREPSRRVRAGARGRPDPDVAGGVRPRSAAAAQLGPAPRRPRAVLKLIAPTAMASVDSPGLGAAKPSAEHARRLPPEPVAP